MLPVCFGVCFGVTRPDEAIAARRAPIFAPAERQHWKAALEVAGVPGESGVAATRGERTPREARVRVDRAEVSAPWQTKHAPDPDALQVAGRDEAAAPWPPSHGRPAGTMDAADEAGRRGG